MRDSFFKVFPLLFTMDQEKKQRMEKGILGEIEKRERERESAWEEIGNEEKDCPDGLMVRQFLK